MEPYKLKYNNFLFIEKEVDEKQNAQLLYSCYYKFEEEGRKKDFEEYCNEANIDFLYNSAYYYI